MKYLSFVSLIGFSHATSYGGSFSIDVDQAAIQQAAMEYVAQAQEVQGQGMELGQAIGDELLKAATKIEISKQKLIVPVLEEGIRVLKLTSFSEDCQVEAFYQCLVDEGTSPEFAMFETQGDCATENNCKVPMFEEDFDFLGSIEASQEFEAKLEETEQEVFGPIQKDLQRAAMQQRQNAQDVANAFMEATKQNMIAFGCNEECIDMSNLQIYGIGYIAEMCSCPDMPISINIDMQQFYKIEVGKLMGSKGIKDTVILASKPKQLPKDAGSFTFYNMLLFLIIMGVSSIVYEKFQRYQEDDKGSLQTKFSQNKSDEFLTSV